MTPRSAKAKGATLQRWIVDRLTKVLGLDPADLESRPMGSNGEDVILGVQSRRVFPYSLEAKNQERVNVWSAYEQAKSNAKHHEPLVIIKRNRKSPLAVVDAEHFFELVRKANQ